MAAPKRPIRIAGASGAASDQRPAISRFAANYETDPVDVIIGDWLSEANMTSLAARKFERLSNPSAPPAFAVEFLEALSPALDDISKYGIKLAVNAGASDTELLHKAVTDLVQSRNVPLKVAWISGDEVLDTLKARPDEFRNVYTNEKLADWTFESMYAQAYLGGLGISTAFERGADIVICGRVSDASLIIGAAAWWHGWNRHHLDELANALVAGHLIECSTYVTGGNFSGFQELEEGGRWLNLGYPIAEIGWKGDVVITKQKNTGGTVSVDTCKAQLLYEIQGPWYFNSDVTAILDDISFKQLDDNHVQLSGVKSAPPPPTTKVGITAHGSFQAEMQYFLVGLDIPVKARMLETQVRHLLGSHAKERLSLLEFQKIGTAAPDPRSQNAATVTLRILAQAKQVEDLAPDKFMRPIIDLIMSAYPGGTFNLDFRQGIPRPIFEYYVTLMKQSDVKQRVHLQNGETVELGTPEVTKLFDAKQPSEPFTQVGVDLASFGETRKAPVGLVVHARSGDKGSNSNVGFWVRDEKQWDWLRTFLSTERVKALLADEYKGEEIDRFELPHIWAVHFLLHNHLDRGVSCTSTLDFLGKNVAEFLRARHVDLPVKFLKIEEDSTSAKL